MMQDYKKCALKTTIARTSLYMQPVRELVDALDKSDNIDEEKAAAAAKKCVVNLKNINAELDALRLRLEGVLSSDSEHRQVTGSERIDEPDSSVNVQPKKSKTMQVITGVVVCIFGISIIANAPLFFLILLLSVIGIIIIKKYW